MNHSQSIEVYRTLRPSLISMTRSPGSQIKIGEVADELRVSPIPVREAFVRLAVERLVEHRQGVGYFVRPLDLDEIQDDYRAIHLGLHLAVDTVTDQKGCSTKFDALDLADIRNGSESALKDIQGFYGKIFSFLPSRTLHDAVELAVDRTYHFRAFDFATRASLDSYIQQRKTFTILLQECRIIELHGFISRAFDEHEQNIEGIYKNYLLHQWRQSSSRVTRGTSATL